MAKEKIKYHDLPKIDITGGMRSEDWIERNRTDINWWWEYRPDEAGYWLRWNPDKSDMLVMFTVVDFPGRAYIHTSDHSARSVPLESLDIEGDLWFGPIPDPTVR